MKTPDRCRIGSPPGTPTRHRKRPHRAIFRYFVLPKSHHQGFSNYFSYSLSTLDFSHLGGKGIDTLLLDCTRSSDRGAYLLPTMVIRLLAPSMQLLFKRVANTTPGI